MIYEIGTFLVLDEFTHRHIPVIGEPYEINPAGQITDVNLCFRFDDLVSDEFLSIHVHN